MPQQETAPKRRLRDRLKKVAKTTAIYTGIVGGATWGGIKIANQIMPPPKVAKDVDEETSAFLRSLLKNHNHIAFGDTDHTAEEINLFIAAHMKALKDAGVEAIFLEIEREPDPMKMDAMLANKSSNQLIPTNDYINKIAKEHGIKVFCMDVPFISEEAKRGAQLWYDYMRALKKDGPDADTTKAASEKRTGPDHEAFLKERREANQAWADFIEEKSKDKKSVSVSGTYHLFNPIEKDDDFDEMIAAKDCIKSCVRVDIKPRKVEHFKIKHPFAKRGEADYFIEVPKLHDTLKKELTLEIFKHLVESRQWETINSQFDPNANLDGIPLYLFMEMQRENDAANSELYKKFSYKMIRDLKSAGLWEDCAKIPAEQLHKTYIMLGRFESSLAECKIAARTVPRLPEEKRTDARENIDRVELALKEARSDYIKKKLPEAIEKLKKSRIPNSKQPALVRIDDLERTYYDLRRENIERKGYKPAAQALKDFGPYYNASVRISYFTSKKLGETAKLTEEHQKLDELIDQRRALYKEAREELFNENPAKVLQLIKEIDEKDNQALEMLAKHPAKSKDSTHYVTDEFVLTMKDVKASAVENLEKWARKLEADKGKANQR